MTIEAPVKNLLPPIKKVWANPLLAAVTGFAVHCGVTSAYWKSMTHQAPEPGDVLALAEPQRLSQTNGPEFRGFINALQASWGSDMDEAQLEAISSLVDRRLEQLDNLHPVTPRENFRRRQETQRLAELMAGFVRRDMDLASVTDRNPGHEMVHLYNNPHLKTVAFGKAAEILGKPLPYLLTEIDLAEEFWQRQALLAEIEKVVGSGAAATGSFDNAHIFFQHAMQLSLHNKLKSWLEKPKGRFRIDNLVTAADAVDDFTIAFELYQLHGLFRSRGISLDALPAGLIDPAQLDKADIFYLDESYPGTAALRQELVRREIASGNFAHAWTGIKKDPASPLSAAIQYMAEIFPNASQPQVGRLPDYEDPKIGR